MNVYVLTLGKDILGIFKDIEVARTKALEQMLLNVNDKRVGDVNIAEMELNEEIAEMEVIEDIAVDESA